MRPYTIYSVTVEAQSLANPPSLPTLLPSFSFLFDIFLSNFFYLPYSLFCIFLRLCLNFFLFGLLYFTIFFLSQINPVLHGPLCPPLPHGPRADLP
jgi:hypothetical protein